MKKLNFKKLLTNRLLIFSLLVLVAVFFLGKPAEANWAANVVGSIVEILIRGVSAILILLVSVLMKVAAYSDFINAPAVKHGWVVVRDVCNMFFVVILLVIAFATILGKEEYGVKKMLPKLVMAAVLINFSKMICGLMIDVANVVMLTFVNAFSAIGAGNIISILGIEKITKLAESGDITFATIVTSYIFGLIYVLIATVVVASMLAMLVIRMVMIWILTVLSPLAFFLQSVPGKGASYASQWWGRWTSNLIVGPVIAFFLWLSFAALQVDTNPIKSDASDDAEFIANTSDLDGGGAIATEAGSVTSMISFVVAIGMLIGGMQIAQSVGGEAGGALAGGMKALNKGKAKVFGAGAALGAGAVALGSRGLKAAGRGTRNLALTGIAATGKKDPITGRPQGQLQQFALQWRDDLKAGRQEKKVAAREKFFKKMGIGEDAALKGKKWLDTVSQKVVPSKLAAVKLAPSPDDYKTAQDNVKAYEYNQGTDGLKSDETTIRDLRGKIKANPNYTFNATEQAAVDRYRSYLDNQDTVSNFDKRKAFGISNAAMKGIAGKKTSEEKAKREKTANDRMAAMLKMDDPVSEVPFYDADGLSESNKMDLDSLNTGELGSAAYKMRRGIVDRINERTGTTPIAAADLENMSLSVAAFQKSGEPLKYLAEVKQALQDYAVRHTTPLTNPDNVRALAKVNFKEFDSKTMRWRQGKGAMEYNTLGKNSTLSEGQRDTGKDIMGLSFAQFDKAATKLGAPVALGKNPGATLSGDSLKQSLPVLSSLIDDEIASVTKSAGSNPSSSQMAKINQLQAIKGRLKEGSDLDNLRITNSDVQYLGETATAQRTAKYNTIQHEQIHSFVKDEALTIKAADALGDAKLIGRIPGTTKRYDTELAKMMSNMIDAEMGTEQIERAMIEQISKWKVPNVQRVLESEQGTRSNIAKEVAATSATGPTTIKGVTTSATGPTVIKETITTTTGPTIVKEATTSTSSSTVVKEAAATSTNSPTTIKVETPTVDVEKVIGELTNRLDEMTSNITSTLNSPDRSDYVQTTTMSAADAGFFRKMFRDLKSDVVEAIGEEASPMTVMASRENMKL